jgi:hypothetical protein
MVQLQTLFVRSTSRLRLRFSSALAAGAFSTSWFTLASVDAAGADPVAIAALVVASRADELELALSPEFVGGGRYELTIAAGLPAVDLTELVETVQEFWAPIVGAAPSPSVQHSDRANEVYGVDLLHDGTDFVRAANFDLATVGGLANVQGAIPRRLTSDGLPYNPEFGGHARQFVDAPTPVLPVARGRLEAEARRDSRVREAKVELARENENDGTVVMNVDARLVGSTGVTSRKVL